jgi:hypothetical protein
MALRFIRGPAVFQGLALFTGTGNYVILNEQVLVVRKAVGAATGVTLPGVAFPGQRVLIKDGKGDAAANNITVSPDGAMATTIDGAATQVVSTNYGVCEVSWNGVEWNVINKL